MSNKFKIKNLKSQIALLLVIMLSSCNPEAQYETKDVAITISPSTISAA